MVTKLFLLQVILLLLISLLLDWVRLIINKFRKNEFKLRLIDAMPILALYFIHQLTFNNNGFSWDATLIFVWMLIGVLILIHKVYVKRRLTHRNFYLTLWRVGDVYLLIMWLVAGITKIF